MHYGKLEECIVSVKHDSDHNEDDARHDYWYIPYAYFLSLSKSVIKCSKSCARLFLLEILPISIECDSEEHWTNEHADIESNGDSRGDNLHPVVHVELKGH